MLMLSESIKNTIAIVEGYKLGRLIIEDNANYIETEDGAILDVQGLIVEVLAGNEWYRLSNDDYDMKTVEGWPLFGGFHCRYKDEG